jgi:hypothetical protein
MINNKMKYRTLITACILVILLAGSVYAADEGVLFANIAPNALIVLDLSGSMNWTSYGDTLYSSVSQTNCTSDTAYYPTSYTGHTYSCTAATSGTRPTYGDSYCTGPFYTSSRAGYTTDCSRVAIAKTAIFKLLDADHKSPSTNTIISQGTATDDGKMNVQMGFMRFYNAGGEDANTSWTSGNERLIAGFGTKYSSLYCANGTSCVQTSTGASSVNDTMSPAATGGTPLAHSLLKAKAYIENYNSSDNAKTCRQNFAILVTDGADTYACGGNGSEGQADMYKRRKASVANAYALANATLAGGNPSKVKLFVIGFGTSLPEEQRNTLNWMAYFGGTKDSTVSQSGSTTAVTIPASPCTEGSTNDPGDYTLSGYAFFAQTPAALSSALTQAINLIKAGTYSFSTTSLTTARVATENSLIEASFEPISDDPFWKGHLKLFGLDSVTGSISTSYTWDAGSRLASRSSSTRAAYMSTLSNGIITSFSTSIAPETFGLASTDSAGRNAVVGYYLGDSSYNLDAWKLGDIFHASPVTLTTPGGFDGLDLNDAYATFASNHQRTSSAGNRLVLVATNGGQFHAFETGYGGETFSFIPPNLLPKLTEVSHSTHPTLSTHQYFIDGPLSASDVWLGSGDYTQKSAGDWHTYIVFGLGRGVEDPNSGYANGYLWSKSATCDCTTSATVGDCGFSPTYSTTFKYYCGYYAFDYTNTSSAPVFQWTIQPSAGQAPYLAGPWGKMTIGRVKINGAEKWVGFVGGGGYSYPCQTGVYQAPTPDSLSAPLPATAGRGLFVIDISNGTVLANLTNGSMASIVAQPRISDTDGDGFADLAYVGDLAGNVWRFKFCGKNSSASCGAGDWSVSAFFQHDSNSRPIYAATAITTDNSGNQWVYWGTGDKQCAGILNSTDRFYALMDDGTTSFTIAKLKNINSSSFNPASDTTYKGWYYQLAASEKILAEPVVFSGETLFTTFLPYSGTDLCQTGGIATLYDMNYISSSGALTDTNNNSVRSQSLGVGLAQAPLISINPNDGKAGLYVTVGGGLGSARAGFTKKIDHDFRGRALNTNIIYWKDLRVQ